MEIYKAKRDGVAVFLNPDKFEEFLAQGYFIYKVFDLENENLDELIANLGEKTAASEIIQGTKIAQTSTQKEELK